MKSSPEKSSKKFKASSNFKTANTPHNAKRKSPPKKTNNEISPKNEVKEMFIKWFKKNNVAGNIMSKQEVVSKILTRLNAKQEDALHDALRELKSSGLIEIQEDGVTLIWTQKGVDYRI